MSAKRIFTIEDLERETYGFSSDQYLRKDDAVKIGTTGARNILYGSYLWSQIIVEANTFGVLPKKPWDKSGYRAITAAASSGSAGIAEGAAIPATIKPTFLEIGITPKILATSFDISSSELALEGKDDTIKWADLVEYSGQEFKNRINRGLNVEGTTLASTNIESIDRVVSSAAEENNCGWHDADADIYGIVRDTETWADAYVSHLSNVDRTLATSYIDTVLQNVMPYWKVQSSRANKVFITGFDTALRLAQLLQSQLRYNPDQIRVMMGVNGIKTAPGAGAGFEVANYDGIPVIQDNNAVQDTISRITLLDLDSISIGVLKPIQYLESEDYQALDKFVREGVYFMEGELVATQFNSSGKVRDLK